MHKPGTCAAMGAVWHNETRTCPMPRTLIIVPAFNERQTLLEVIRELRESMVEADVVIVNDGSTDDTAAVARRSDVPVLDLAVNLGIGAAVQTGLLYALRYGYDVAIQFDGDGQHRADQIPILLRTIADEKADLVVGSRFLTKSDYRGSWSRRMGIAVLSFVNRLLTGRRIVDSTSGFRAFGPRAIQLLSREYPHDFPEPESIVILSRFGFTVREVGVQMRDRQGGLSSITLWRSLFYMSKVLTATLITATRPRGGTE